MEKVIHYTLEYGIETIPIYVLNKYFQMRIQLFHFTRIPGCNKINQNRRYPPVLTRSKRNLEFYLHHYRYLEETREIRRKTVVVLIPCNNCNEHKVDPRNCELILDSTNRIYGISFKITQKTNKEKFYIIKNNLLLRMLSDIFYLWQPILYYNSDKFFQTYEISKELDLQHTTLGYFYWWQQPSYKTIQYLSILCSVAEKEINIIYQDAYIHTTTIKYGWNMYCICNSHYQCFSKWLICTTSNPNEIVKVSCNKPNFNMYILNNENTPMSLLNLSLSSLYQNELNYHLDISNYFLPKTLCQQAMPCYLFHISPFTLSNVSIAYGNCFNYHISSHIADW